MKALGQRVERLRTDLKRRILHTEPDDSKVEIILETIVGGAVAHHRRRHEGRENEREAHDNDGSGFVRPSDCSTDT